MKKWFLILVLIFSMILSACGILPDGEGENNMAQWISPTSHEDISNNWVYETRAYDNDIDTYSYTSIEENETSGWLVLNTGIVNCTKIRFAIKTASYIESINIAIELYYEGSWKSLYSGNVQTESYQEKSIGNTKRVSAARIRYISGDWEISEGGSPPVSMPGIREFHFYGDLLTKPTVTTTTPVTIKDHESATLEGEITNTGGLSITERGFEYKKGSDGEIFTVSEEDDNFGIGTFELEVIGLEPNTEYYYRAYAVNEIDTGYGDWESFTTDKTIPTIVTNAVTAIDTTTATANGNITSTGGEDCSERGFEYGLTKVATWTVKDTVGGYGTGAYSKGLTGLSPNTIYWIRAYATNSIGTSYGEWVEFQTAVTGATPTNTRITLIGDVSGYVAQMHASETDLDYPYEGYFVLATDLSETNTLIFYKRLLDLDSYFRKETSGNITISIKCDHENNWHEVGNIDLTGDNDIVLKHLASDNLGKHFQVKFSGKNAFRYLGTIFKYVVQGER